jgi:hypothetical protein
MGGTIVGYANIIATDHPRGTLTVLGAATLIFVRRGIVHTAAVPLAGTVQVTLTAGLVANLDAAAVTTQLIVVAITMIGTDAYLDCRIDTGSVTADEWFDTGWIIVAITSAGNTAVGPIGRTTIAVRATI